MSEALMKLRWVLDQIDELRQRIEWLEGRPIEQPGLAGVQKPEGAVELTADTETLKIGTVDTVIWLEGRTVDVLELTSVAKTVTVFGGVVGALKTVGSAVVSFRFTQFKPGAEYRSFVHEDTLLILDGSSRFGGRLRNSAG